MKILPYNSYKSKIEFANKEERDMLKKALSYDVPGHEHVPAFQLGLWDGKKSFLTDADYVSNGLLKSIFPEHPMFYEPSSLTFDDIPLYIVNSETIERRQYQLDAINAIFTHKRMLVEAGTGAGKSWISAASISKHLADDSKNKVLFVCYDKNILDQTVKNFTKKYKLPVSIYGGGSHDLSGRIVVATIQSLNNIVKPQVSLKDITMCFVDESHHSKAKTSRDILSKLPGCNYFVGLTATPPKKGSLEYAELVSVLGPVMFQYSLQESTADGNTAPVKVFILNVPYDANAAEKVVHRKHYQTIWDTGVRDNETRNKCITSICQGLETLLKAPTLINVDRVEHGAELYSKMYGKVNCLCMFGEDNVYSREEKKKQLMNNEINTLITSVAREGVDFAISPVVAINASGRKGFVNVTQFLGRVVRKNKEFGNFRVCIDFIDKSNKKLEEHSLARIEAYKDTGSEVIIVSSVNELLTEIIKHYKLSK